MTSDPDTKQALLFKISYMGNRDYIDKVRNFKVIFFLFLNKRLPVVKKHLYGLWIKTLQPLLLRGIAIWV